MKFMKSIFFCVLAMLIATPVFCQANRGKTSCMNDNLSGAIRDSLVDRLNERAEKNKNNVAYSKNITDFAKVFSWKDFSEYIDNAAYFSKGINCGKIDSYSIIEIMLAENVTERMWYYYLLVHLESGISHVYLVDKQRKKRSYLGKVKKDFFDKLTRTLLLTGLREPVGYNYLLYFNFSTEKLRYVDIGTGLFSIWQIEPLSLLEEALFRRNKLK